MTIVDLITRGFGVLTTRNKRKLMAARNSPSSCGHNMTTTIIMPCCYGR